MPISLPRRPAPLPARPRRQPRGRPRPRSSSTVRASPGTIAAHVGRGRSSRAATIAPGAGIRLSRPWPASAFAGRSPASPRPGAAGGRMLRPRRLSVLLCTVLRASGLPPLPATPQEPERGIAVQEYVLSELDTGERLITERVASVRSSALGFWSGAGARDEPDARAGVSHFIEHLLFKGTRSYSAQEIAETFDGLGGELNAATSREHTVVFGRVPDRHLETALDVMADMVFSPTFADVDSEREVALEE